MGRVKIPRCDNCGAPVEFAQGVLEARCEYCNEVLIREFPVAPAPAPVAYRPPPAPLPPPPAPAPRGTVAPFMLAGLATLAIAGASSIASFASRFQPLPDAAPPVRDTLAVAAPIVVEREATTVRPSEARSESAQRPRTADTVTAKGRPRPRPTAANPTAAPTPAEPPKAPRFDTAAAVAGLDAAKAQAEIQCKGASGVRVFVQMGFDADGVNRGAALSDSKLKGTPEAKCTLRLFRAVRIPAFDMATRPSGLGRAVRL